MKFWREVDGLLLRQAADHAENIRRAIAAQVDVNAIVAQWTARFPEGGVVAPQEARDWVHEHFTLNPKPLQVAVDHLLATGYVMGQDVALAAYSHARLNVNKAPSASDIASAVNTDWANWKPGNRAAAALVRPPGRLEAILADGKASISGMNDVTLNRVGTLLADSLQAGQGYSTVARQLLTDNVTNRVVNDSARATTIAVTEMSRALNLATVDSYNEYGVEKVEWLALEPCDECEQNVEDGAIPLGEEFSSGDTEPPAHPNCRCSLIPVVDEGAAAAEDTGDGSDNVDVTDESDVVDAASEMEISDVADHSIEDVLAEPAAPVEFKPALWEDIPALPAETDREKQALETYSGPLHRHINVMLRGSDIRSSGSRYKVPEAQAQLIEQSAAEIKSMMARTSLPENIKVERYLDAEELQLNLRQVIGDNAAETAANLIGSVFENKSFLSTSALRSDVVQIDNPFKERQVKLILDLPAGSRAGRNSINRFKNEAEVLIDAGSTYIVTNAYIEGKYFVVEALLGEQ